MKILLGHMLTPREWAGLAGGLVAAGLIYALLVHPSLELFADLDRARLAKTEAEARLEQSHAKFDKLHRQIANAKKRLAELGGPPPHTSEKDFQVARLTTLARRCGITIDQYSPIDTVDNGDYRAFFFQFAGRGDFKSIWQYFDRIESEIDFVDLTHFTISSIPTGSAGACSVAWSSQINGMRTDTLDPAQSVQRAVGSTPSMEVALHGP